MLVMSAFLVDASLTLAGRILRREQWWTAHVAHAYQRLAARTGSHARVTFAYGAWTAGAVAVALMLAGQAFRFKLAAVAGGVALAAVAWRAARGPRVHA